MKKIYLLALIFLFSSGVCTAAEQTAFQEGDVEQYKNKMDLVKSIESLRADHQVFINAIKDAKIAFQEVSPTAVANYMEAFANEGMLEWIPREYFDNGEIKISLYVVFEDISNTNSNKRFYERRFMKIRKRDLLIDIENSGANYQDFVNAIKSRRIAFQEVSPVAVANYMEAFANEGMLESIPDEYFDSAEITTSLYVVFEHPENIANNWDMFEDRLILKRICSNIGDVDLN